MARVFTLLTVLLALCPRVAGAQDQPPSIGPFVVDLRGVFPMFPDDPQLAASRGLTQEQLPGRGLGVDIGAHLYVIRWRAITIGIGGELIMARAHRTFDAEAGLTPPGPVTEHFTSVASQISFNFGTGAGWSYLSGGIGRSVWSVVPDGQASRPADEERLPTINYGGGARWFAKKHLAFSVDVRFYAISPGLAELGYPGSPHTTLIVMGGGISVK